MRARPDPAAGPRAAALLAGLLLTGAGLAACSSAPPARPEPVASSYLTDWARRDWPAMRKLVAAPPAGFTAMNAAALSGLGVRQASYTAGRMRTSGARASEPVTQRLQIPGIGTVTIRTVLRLAQHGGKWLVDWSPATIAPSLRPEDRLSIQVTWPSRAPVLGGAVPLTTQAPIVTIGVEGQRVKNPATLTAALVAVGATTAQARSALAAAKKEPTWFEPVLTVSRARYEQLKPKIYPIPGTVFEAASTRAAITPGLSAYVVGTVGPVTAAQLHALGAPYTAQSIVGQTGLELADERQLAGSPGATVTVVDRHGGVVATLARIRPRPGTAVRTTIDPRVQRAAEAALAGQHKSAAMVAVNAGTGAILAVASVPTASGFDQALDGGFPPGSSFKVVTTTALINHGLTPRSAARCPLSITVDGEVFHNSEGTGPVSDLLHAFAESCNTAFIGLATRHLTAPDFSRTAALYGIGRTPRIGLPAFGGSVPAPADEADLAATTIGQGRVLMSPLAMAMVAAAADTGTVHAPRLVLRAAEGPDVTGHLSRAVVSGLHQMMAQVVATGTASHQGLPAGTYAKTGTAQYGTGHPLRQDAWLVGFNGTIAFAMVVVNGGEGGPTDGPLVARFFRLLRVG